LAGRHAICLVAGTLLLSGAACDGVTAGEPEFPGLDSLATETVGSGFDTIWELAWGPDGFIWITERGGSISRLNPGTGDVSEVGDVSASVEIGEGGLMGLTFHPDFTSQPWVYVAHTYGAPGTRNRIVRMRYENGTLGPPEVIVADIPGSSIHNGARLAVGPDGFIYATTGDAADPTLAQNTATLAGKVLRFTPEGQPAPGNPFGNLVFSYGHRNPQGMAFSPDGQLYITEHGASDNDEVNLVQAGRNYGWPAVRGRCDGDAGGGEVPFCETNNVAEPLAIWTPTIAPAGLAYYDHSLMPQLRGLLFATLKDATLYHLSLSADGRTVTAGQRLYIREFGRLRAVLVAPDGSVYIGTSSRDGRGSPMPTDDRVIRIRPR
jgi:glucose/arabinose dehydrogenase